MARLILEHSRTVSETRRTRLEFFSNDLLSVPVVQRATPLDPRTGSRLPSVIAPETISHEPEDF